MTFLLVAIVTIAVILFLSLLFWVDSRTATATIGPNRRAIGIRQRRHVR